MMSRWLIKGDRRDVLVQGGLALILRLAGAAAQFLLGLTVARMFGAEGLGIYTLAITLSVVMAVLGRWGMDQAVLKHVAILAGQNRWHAVREIQIKAFQAVSLVSLPIALIVFEASAWIAEVIFRQPALQSVLELFAWSIVPLALLNTLAEGLRAIGNTAAYTWVQTVLMSVMTLTVLMAMGNNIDDIRDVVVIYVASCFVSLAFGFVLWRKTLSMRAENAIDAHGAILPALTETALPMAWLVFIATMMSFSETLLLGMFRDPVEVGIYAAALRLAMLSGFVVAAVNSVLAPKFAVMVAKGEREAVRVLVRHSVLLMLALSSPLFVVLLVFPEFALGLFGQQFSSGWVVLELLALSQLFNVIVGPAGLLLMMGGHEQRMRKITLLTWVISLVAGLSFIPYFGAVGAACSAFIGIVMLNLLAIRSVRQLIGIQLVRL